VYVAFRNTVLNIIDEMGDTCVKRNGKKRRPMGFPFGRTKKNRAHQTKSIKAPEWYV
jgi:hypothetical protein